jgi:hypothetical protein
VSENKHYTLVQHSAYVGKGDPQFRRGVHQVPIHGQKELAKVREAGGLVFDSWDEAEDAADRESYPEGAGWLIPRAAGSFSTKVKVDGLPLYIPAEQKEEA